MIELRITGETPTEFLQQIAVAANALLFRQAVVNAGAAPATPIVGNVEKENPTPDGSAEHPFPPEALPPVEATESKARGRKKATAAEPAPEAVAEQPAVEAVAEEIEVPKDLDGMRSLLGKVLAKFGEAAVKEIFLPFAPALSKVSLDNYPDMARQAHKKLAEDAA